MNYGKIRAGLYEKRFQINNSNKEVVYRIERNEGHYNSGYGQWYINIEIGTWRDVSIECFDTKRAAVAAVNQMAGSWHYRQGLGWCFDA